LFPKKIRLNDSGSILKLPYLLVVLVNQPKQVFAFCQAKFTEQRTLVSHQTAAIEKVDPHFL
jgi:hypothetical protein